MGKLLSTEITGYNRMIFVGYFYFYFVCYPTIADESNQTFIRHDDAVLLPERMHPEHKPTVCSVRDKNPTEDLDS